MDNKYNIDFSAKTLSSYFRKLTNGCFKILPLYDGLDVKTKEVIYSPEEAHEMYLKYLQNFIYEVCGGYILFNESEKFLTLLTSLESMMTIPVNEKGKLKPLVFSCINICKKLERGCTDEIL
jgi:hypothetical protein